MCETRDVFRFVCVKRCSIQKCVPVESHLRKVLHDRRELLEEEGDVIGEYKAMHEDNFLSSWLSEDGKEMGDRIMEQALKPKKKGVKGGGEKRIMKKTRLGLSKEDVSVLFRWMIL